MMGTHKPMILLKEFEENEESKLVHEVHITEGAVETAQLEECLSSTQKAPAPAQNHPRT